MGVRTVHCPKCDNQNLCEKNTGYAEIGILDWEWDEGADAPQPAAYETDVSVDWDIADDPRPYTCATCGWEGTLGHLVVKEAATPVRSADAMNSGFRGLNEGGESVHTVGPEQV